MEITISSPHLNLTDQEEQLLRHKVDHLARLYRRIESCDVVVKKIPDDASRNYFLEGKLRVPRRTLFASDQAETLDIAIEKLVSDLEHGLRQYKEELEDYR
ncbi:MAG TPA: HPF/RaiA family ribosome-associated protein [Chitinophagaceae bacterium]|nr:HPF/RaiA family ribosome-associated protein [Chitinophagaceae bacterium]